MELDQVPATGIIRVLPWVLGGTALTATVVHVLLALDSQGAMAVVMGAMGLLCLTCLPHLRATTGGVEKSAFHLMAMSATMALVHLVWIVVPGMAAHSHGHNHAMAMSANPGAGHGAAMLGLIALELLALCLAAVVMRINRSLSVGIAQPVTQ